MQEVKHQMPPLTWIPRLGMKIRHRKAESTVRFEPSIRCNHDHAWGFVRILFREDQLAVIHPALVRGFRIIRWSLEDVVPLEDVRFVGLGDDFWVGEWILM